jgi:hypothetical protein
VGRWVLKLFSLIVCFADYLVFINNDRPDGDITVVFSYSGGLNSHPHKPLIFLVIIHRSEAKGKIEN